MVRVFAGYAGYKVMYLCEYWQFISCFCFAALCVFNSQNGILECPVKRTTAVLYKLYERAVEYSPGNIHRQYWTDIHDN